MCWSNLQDLDDVPADDAVYILVFGAGTGSEGLYSLQERTKDDVPVDIILAFPTHEDAARYGTLLEAEMGRVPVVEAARPEDLKYTCREGGYRCKVARRGVLLMPPEKTVEVTDWERTNALRQGQWSVQGFEEQLSSDMDAQLAGYDRDDQRRDKSPNVGVLSADDFKAQYEAVCGDAEDDEACSLPPDYDEEAARQQLMKMFNRETGTRTDDEEAGEGITFFSSGGSAGTSGRVAQSTTFGAVYKSDSGVIIHARARSCSSCISAVGRGRRERVVSD